MADRYWVGGTNNWDTTAGTKWATTSGGAGGAAVPVASDDVYFNAASGVVTVTFTTAGPCRSLNFTGFSGTFVHNAIVLSIGAGSAAAGNIALKMSPTMTYTLVSNDQSRIFFSSTHSTPQTIDYAGKTAGQVVFNGIGGSWQLVSAFTQGSANTSFSLNNGTLDLNGQSVICGNFLSTTTTARTLTMGSSAITVTQTGSSVNFTSATGLTVTANTATLTQTGTVVDYTFNWVGTTNGLSLVQSARPGQTIIAGSPTLANYTRICGASALDTVTLSGDLTVTGTFNVQGNNSTVNRALVCSSFPGTSRTLSAGTVTVANIDFRDINAAGAGSWNLAAITGLSGDCGGNTNITFTAATTQTATGTTSFTWSAHGWTTRVPLPQDTASIPNAFIANQAITINVVRVGTIIFTGSGAVQVNTSGSQLEVYGDVTLRAGMGAITFNSSCVFIGAADQTLATNGMNLNSNSFGNAIRCYKGKLSFTSGFTFNAGIGADRAGYLDTQNVNISCVFIQFTAASGLSLLGTSTITITTGSTSPVGLNGNSRVSAANATFIISASNNSRRDFTLGSTTVGTVTYTVASSPGTLSIVNGGTINTLNVGSARRLWITQSNTLNVTNFNVAGAILPLSGLILAGNAVENASTPSTAAVALTGSVDLRARATMASWTSAATKYMFGKWGGANGYSLNVTSTGAISMGFFDGSTQFGITSSVITGFVAGSTNWIRGTWNQTTKLVRFYTSTDGNTWTQLGTDLTLNFVSIGVDTTSLAFGCLRTSDGFGAYPMTLHQAQIRNNTLDDGTGIVLDVDFSTKPWGAPGVTETANGALVTFNGDMAVAHDGATRMQTNAGGSTGTLSKPSGVVTATNVSIRDVIASGGATWNAVDSFNAGNNTGWNFLTSWKPQVVMVS